jgi:hypothetical protein
MTPMLRSGRVNHTTVKDISEGEEVLAGTSLTIWVSYHHLV